MMTKAEKQEGETREVVIRVGVQFQIILSVTPH
jgi:hypothetical protein